MKFKERVEVGFQFACYVKRNDIILPVSLKKRRKLFIDWYIERNRAKSFDENFFNHLAEDILFISPITLRRIMFNEN